METAIGRVESLRGETVTVIVDAPVACRRCASGKGCGAGLLGGSESTRRIDMTIPAGMRLAVGDPVSLSVSPRQLLRAAAIAYGIALAAFLAATGLARIAGDGSNDLLAIAIAVSGLGAGILLSRRLLRQDGTCRHFVPIIEERQDR